MPYPDNLLARGERVIVNKNPHWKVLILPVLFFLLIVGGGVALLIWLQNWEYFHIAWIAIAVLMLVGLIWLVVVPVIRWRTEHFAISNHHVFFRTGLLSRREHQIPLSQIANMETEVTFWGRLMGYGTLVVESSADAPLKFHNIAELPKTQATLNQLIRDERDAYSRGRWADEDPQPAAGPAADSADRYDGTYLADLPEAADRGDEHPAPGHTPTRVFGAAPRDDRYDERDAPRSAAAPEQAAPAYGAPQYGAPQPPYPANPYDVGSPPSAAPDHGRPQDRNDPYGGPQPGYGAPQQGHAPPQPGYGGTWPGDGASDQYGAPQRGYGGPQPGYGAPQHGYGAPQHPYGAPQHPYGAPQPGDGAPTQYAPRQGDGATARPGPGAPPQHGHPIDPPTDPWLNRPGGHPTDTETPGSPRDSS